MSKTKIVITRYTDNGKLYYTQYKWVSSVERASKYLTIGYAKEAAKLAKLKNINYEKI